MLPSASAVAAHPYAVDQSLIVGMESNYIFPFSQLRGYIFRQIVCMPKIPGRRALRYELAVYINLGIVVRRIVQPHASRPVPMKSRAKKHVLVFEILPAPLRSADKFPACNPFSVKPMHPDTSCLLQKRSDFARTARTRRIPHRCYTPRFDYKAGFLTVNTAAEKKHKNPLLGYGAGPCLSPNSKRHTANRSPYAANHRPLCCKIIFERSFFRPSRELPL